MERDIDGSIKKVELINSKDSKLKGQDSLKKRAGDALGSSNIPEETFREVVKGS